jgi:hypothetical protein
MSAATGFQSKGIDREALNNLFKGTMSGEDRIIEFIQTSLRSAKDIYLHGGHVTMTHADRIFRMEYDNKRILEVPSYIRETNDFSNVLLDSRPSPNTTVVRNLRYLGSVHKKRDYNRLTTKGVGSKYKNNLEIAIRNFIKGIVATPVGYNLTPFESYSELINFVKGYKPDYKISKSSISNLKSRRMVVKGIPKNPETIAFAEYVKMKFPDFNEKSFFNES